VDIQDHDGVHVAAITGEVDISNVDDVTRRLIALPNFAPGLVVDLRLVTYGQHGHPMLHDLAGRFRDARKLIVVSAGFAAAAVLEPRG
jgi:hypothetical protein